MRNLHLLDLNRLATDAVIKRFGGPGDHTCGVFEFKSTIDRAPLLCHAASSGKWEFVSVSRKRRTPNWPEMEQIRRLFFEENEIVVQFHILPKGTSNTLYLWHPTFDLFPELPPFSASEEGEKIEDGTQQK